MVPGQRVTSFIRKKYEINQVSDNQHLICAYGTGHVSSSHFGRCVSFVAFEPVWARGGCRLLGPTLCCWAQTSTQWRTASPAYRRTTAATSCDGAAWASARRSGGTATCCRRRTSPGNPCPTRYTQALAPSTICHVCRRSTPMPLPHLFQRICIAAAANE